MTLSDDNLDEELLDDELEEDAESLPESTESPAEAASDAPSDVTPEEEQELEEEEEEESGPRIGPRSVSPLAIVTRAIGGLGGGIVGTGLIILIAFFGSSVLQSAIGVGGGEGDIHPLFVFVFMAMIFIGSLAANLLGPLFIGLMERDKYQNTSTTLYQIFFVNLVILIAMAPIYMVVAGINIGLIASIAALQVVVSSFASALILEIVADPRSSVVAVYSNSFAVLLSSGLFFFIYSVSTETPVILLFMALPVMWLAIGLFSGILGYLYVLIYKLYGVDFLSTSVRYGEDENREAVQAEDARRIEERAASYGDESGASFLTEDREKRGPKGPTPPQATPPAA